MNIPESKNKGKGIFITPGLEAPGYLVPSLVVWEQIRGPQWPHNDPTPFDPPVEQDQEERLVYLSESLNKDK